MHGFVFLSHSWISILEISRASQMGERRKISPNAGVYIRSCTLPSMRTIHQLGRHHWSFVPGSVSRDLPSRSPPCHSFGHQLCVTLFTPSSFKFIVINSTLLSSEHSNHALCHHRPRCGSVLRRFGVANEEERRFPSVPINERTLVPLQKANIDCRTQTPVPQLEAQSRPQAHAH